MGGTLATLAVSLTAKADSLYNALDDTEKRANSWATKIGSTIKTGLAAGVAVGAAAVVAGVLAIGGAAWSVASDFQGATNSIIVGTGASGAALQEMESIVISLKGSSAGLGSSYEQLGAVVAEVNTRTGATGEALQSFSNDVLELSRLTGGDAVTNTQLITRVMGDWGVEMQDSAGLMDMLFGAGQAFGIGMENISAKVVQFGAPLRQMGFTLEESVAMFGKWEREGVNAELAIGSLRIAAGKFARENVPLREGLLSTMEAIKGAATESEALALGMEVFGARAGPDMTAAIRENRFELESAIETLQGTTGGLADAADRALTFGDKFTIMKDRVMGSLLPMGNAMLDFVSEKVFPALETGADAAVNFTKAILTAPGEGGVLLDYLQELPTWLQPVALWLGNLAIWLSENVPQAIAVATSYFQGRILPALQNFGAYLSAVVIPAIINLAGWFTGTLIPAISNLASWFTGTLIPAISNLASWFTGTLIPAAQNTAGTIQNEVMGAFTAVNGVLIELGAALAPAGGLFLAFAANIIEAFKGGGLPGAIGAFKSLWPGILATVQTAINSIVGFISKKIGIDLLTPFTKARAYVGTAFEVIGGIISSVVSTIGPTVQTMISGFTGAFSSFAPVGESFKNLWQTLAPIVTFAMQVIGAVLLGAFGIVVGVFNGIVAAINPLITTLGFVLNGVIVFVDGVIQFFTGLFQTIWGILTGNTELIMQGWEAIKSGITGIVLGLVEAVVGLWEGLKATLYALVGGLIDGVIAFFQNLYQTLVGGSIIPDMVTAILLWINKMVLSFVEYIVNLWTQVKSLFTAAFAFLSGILTTALANLLAKVVAWLTNMLANITQKFNEIKSFISNIWATIRGVFETAKGNLLTTVGGMVTSILAKWQSINWGEVGTNIIQGIANAIANGAGAIAEAARGAAQAALDAAKTALGINSPSKFAADQVGEPFSAGVGVGIAKNFSPIQKAINDLVSGPLSPDLSNFSKAPVSSNGGGGLPSFSIQIIIQGDVRDNETVDNIAGAVVGAARQLGISF